MDKKFFGKIDETSDELKPVVQMAAKDATMLVAACMFGEITSEDDDANYTATKEKFIELVVLNQALKDDFDGALNNEIETTNSS